MKIWIKKKSNKLTSMKFYTTIQKTKRKENCNDRPKGYGILIPKKIIEKKKI